jgi:hypothetical protein
MGTKKDTTKKARRKTASKKKKSKTSVTMGPPSQDGALADIQKRAVGGKVAVLDRGSNKATILGEGDDNKKAPKAAPEQPPHIPLSQDAQADLRMVLDEIGQLERNAGQQTINYQIAMKNISERAESLQGDFQSMVRRLGKRFDVPDTWVLNLDIMAFIPNPNIRQ